jgi:hypothetical protein
MSYRRTVGAADTHQDTHRLRPFWGRVLVLESPVDESERPSGLIVPMGEAGSTQVKRGVVLHIDPWHGEPIPSAEEILPGTVVYYIDGVQVLDGVILERSQIYAYEVND